MEATTNSSIEPLLPSKAWYTRSLTYAGDKLMNFWSYLRSICVDQSNARHAMIS
ncbi:hypothetical protein BHE74_00050961 [Ensete ventricosum]|nr:hypothetical protein GW17_00048917 [Ensete ventricosum]RWW43390.1 hypothetical protein BHE74_00050961 [Ensete ventricosum]RZS22991.1 hypothetical protein BHM03_00055832 [Ensete ventricosum]